MLFVEPMVWNPKVRHILSPVNTCIVCYTSNYTEFHQRNVHIKLNTAEGYNEGLLLLS